MPQTHKVLAPAAQTTGAESERNRTRAHGVGPKTPTSVSQSIPQVPAEPHDGGHFRGAALYVPDVNNMDTLTAALTYAEAGWYVLPVMPETKHPGSVVGAQWQTKSSRDPKVITAWFAGTNYAVALHVGRSGGLVFDVDNPDAMPPELRDAVTELAPPYQSTRVGEPLRGHYVFAAEPGRYGNSAGSLGTGWGEVRGWNGIIVVAPSVHAKANAGGRYQWERTGPVPELPPTLATALRPPSSSAGNVGTAQVSAFLAGLPTGPACRAVAAVPLRMPVTGRHDTMRDTVLRLARLGEQGHRGVCEALEELKQQFVVAASPDRAGGDTEAAREYDRALAGAVAVVQARPTPESDRGCCPDLSPEYDMVEEPAGDADTDSDTDSDSDGRMGPTARRAMAQRPGLHVGSPAVAVEWLREHIGTGPLSGFFLRDGEIVHCPAEGEEGYIPPRDERDHDGPAQVRTVTAGQLRARVQAAYYCYRVKELPGGTKKKIATLFPREAAPFIIDAPDTAPNLRTLAGVTHTPLVRRDGTILDRPGYDPATRLLYLPDPQMSFTPVPERPSTEQVREAVGIIDRMVADFPFVSADDRANYIGLMLTPLLRQIIPPPYKLGVFTAPMRRSGKTLLATLLRRIHGGVVRAEAPTDEAEWSKTISTILNVTTGPVVIFDNITGTLRSGTLDSLLTSDQVDARQLGSTREMISRRNDRLWTITSNNAQLGGDLIPRSLWVRIDPGQPHPEMRTGFAIPDIDLWVQTNRGDILTALLTLVRAWVVAGQPQERTGDIYGRWVGAVRGILHVAGIPGLFDAPTSRGQHVSDEDEEAVAFLAEIERVFGNRPWMASEVISKVAYLAGINPNAGIPVDCLPQVVTSRPREVQAKVLGHWLRWRVGAWFGDSPARRLCPAGEHKKTRLYRIESR